MISFRYHLVSLVSVLLALGLGIVVGSTLLNGPITKDLRNQVNDAKSQRDKLAAENKVLQGEVDDAGQFAATYSSQLVANTLTSQTVLVVSLPGTTAAMRDGASALITSAGGKVAGQLSITKDYLDSSRGSRIITLATGAGHPIGLTLPETSDAGQLGGALLAYVLLGKGQPTDLNQVLGGLSELHMVTVDSGSIASSTTVLVLGRGGLPTNDYGGRAELSLVAALAQRGGKVVVAGDETSAANGGIVSLVRSSPSVHDVASTVDNADSAQGQVSAVLALAAAIKGEVGHYGKQTGADALFPSPNR